ncbi:hypothetical protein CPB84DRAFT_1843641 [Gymnopilus junonius]|uniref:F-box protein n=1 Tax=Gymnopilus junonius TaxID=109634 RepID=A0A9P5NX45_GYMJU|nr:hypothetical protein CPB84DRAFT_1843641 [Gymnopilus junonius]
MPVLSCMDLPTEIWNECCALIPKKGLKNLALTCHFFHDVSLPFLFEKIACRFAIVSFEKFPSGEKIPEELLQILTKVLKHFAEAAASEKHVAHVQNCIFGFEAVEIHQGHNTFGLERCTAPWVTLAFEILAQGFIASLPQFTEVRQVVISGFNNMSLGEGLYTALAALPHLHATEFEDFIFSAHTNPPRLNLRNVQIDNANDNDILNEPWNIPDIFSCQELRNLTLYSIPYAANLFRALSLEGCPQLVNLSIMLHQNCGIPELYSFLESCPNLTTIRVESTELSDTVIILPLPASTIPCLSEFSGPAPFAAAFIPGRPVGCVKISVNLEKPPDAPDVRQNILDKSLDLEEAHLQSLFSSISQSTVSITDIFISYMACRPEFLALVAKYFPELKNFTLDSDACFGLLFPRKLCGCCGSFSSYLPIGDLIGQDPHSSVSDNYLELENDRLVPVLMHDKYMPILHWFAVNGVKFAENLETLNFRAHLPSKFCQKDEGKLIENCRLFGRPYTANLANSILNKLGDNHSVLRKIRVDDELCWTKMWRVRGGLLKGAQLRRGLRVGRVGLVLQILDIFL